jgi:hypothetical protein
MKQFFGMTGLTVCVMLLLSSYGLADMNSQGFEAFPNYYFVETGTYKGVGVQLALRAKFPSIHTVEVDHSYAAMARALFKDNDNVHIYEGDSGQILYDIIKDFDRPITFWLDGHRETPSTDGSKNTPLLQELEQIKRHPIKTHTILIDDLQCCKTILFDFITGREIIQKILEINPRYTFRLLPGGTCGRVPNSLLVAEVQS